MSFLGDSNTPGSGFFFDVTGNKQYWTAAPFVMPAGGGIASDINVYAGGDGSSVTGQIVLWDNSGNIVHQTGSLTIPSGSRAIHGQAWVTSSAINGTYIPAGSYILGFWSSGHVVWTFESSGGVNGRSGLASPGTATGGSDEYGGSGFGRLGAYVTYTPGGVAHVNTGTSGSPVWATGVAQINTGTPGSPIWTPARVRVNTGTSGSPIWTDAT